MPRSRNRNRNYARGLSNRQKGIFKKSHTYNRFYSGDVGVYFKQNGCVTTYESRPGVLRDAGTAIPDQSFGPDDFDTVTDRQPPSDFDDTVAALTAEQLSQFFDKNDDISVGSLRRTSSSSTGSSVATGCPDSSSSPDSRPDSNYGLPGTPFMPFSLDEWYPESPGEVPNPLEETQNYTFPSALLPMPSIEGQGEGHTATPQVAPESFTQEPVVSPSPIPMSLHRKEALLSLIEEYLRE
jgi:hypothetical protein